MRATRHASRVIIRENQVGFRTIPALVCEEANRGLAAICVERRGFIAALGSAALA